MIKLYICCLVLIIGSVEVGLDVDMKFHQVVMKIVSYDTSVIVTVWYRWKKETLDLKKASEYWLQGV